MIPMHHGVKRLPFSFPTMSQNIHCRIKIYSNHHSAEGYVAYVILGVSDLFRRCFDADPFAYVVPGRVGKVKAIFQRFQDILIKYRVI